MIEEMNDHERAIEHQAEQVVETALRDLPLEAPPPELFAAIMRQVQPPAPAPLPVFRVQWTDFALSLLFAGAIGAMLLVSTSLPPELQMELRWQVYWLQSMHFDWLLMAGLLMAAAAAGLAAILFTSWSPVWKDGRG